MNLLFWTSSPLFLQEPLQNNDNIRYSIGLVLVCLIILVVPWLLEVFKNEGE